MASFYYYDQDPSRVLLSCANEGFCYLNLTGATKFKYEKKNEKNSGRTIVQIRPIIKEPLPNLYSGDTCLYPEGVPWIEISL